MKINMMRARQTIAFILLLFYPFNNTISDKILFGDYNAFIFLAISTMLLLSNLKTRSMSKAIAGTLPIILASIVYILIRNEIIGSEPFLIRQLLTQVAYLLVLPFIFNSEIDEKALKYALAAYAIEHIIGTAIPIVAPTFYSSNVLPFICNRASCFAKNAFLNGENAGLTGHYTTNGVYMAIFAIFFMTRYIRSKEKKSLAIGIISVLALLIIGKRAHFIFTVIALLLAYVTKNESFNIHEFIKNNFKLLVIIIAAVISVISLSATVPQINTTIERIAETENSEDAMNGREPLYEIARSEWRKRPIIGNGWGHYIQTSHIVFGEKTYGTDYIHTHNDYLEVLCDKGILGIILYGSLLAWLLIKSYKKRAANETTLFSFGYAVFYILYSMTGTPMNIPANYVFLFISILITIRKEK